MKFLKGFAPLPLFLVFLVLLMGIIGAIMWLISPKTTKYDKAIAQQIEVESQAPNESSKPFSNTPICYNGDVFWNWSTGDKSGKAQVNFAPNNKSAVGNLLDEGGKKSVYSFAIEDNSKISIAQLGTDAHAYGKATVGCDKIEVDITGACNTVCDLERDNPDFLSKVKIDPSSIGVGGTLTITQ